jgi:molybdopterin-guanine dinucleotide biosynthesis protein A
MQEMGAPAGIVLAGGRSSRFGRDKASADLLGYPLIQHVVDRLTAVTGECIIVARQGQQSPPLTGTPLKVIRDYYPDTGPLAGLFTGLLAATESQYSLAVACDMPLLQPNLLLELARLGRQHQAVIPLYEGLPQPLCAAYSRQCLPVLREHLESGNYRLLDAVTALSPFYLGPEAWQSLDPRGLSFLNVNRQEDWKRAALLLTSD